ncbi:MAG: hypothetical protein KBI01_08180, partial [Oscillospiraceae bacterium]|nr:hypothetical protein [Oscillospiraceae bacterium]
IGGNPYTDYVDDNLYSDTIAGNTGMAMMLTLQQPTLMHTSLLLWVLSQLYMATHFLTPQFLSRFSPLQTTQ